MIKSILKFFGFKPKQKLAPKPLALQVKRLLHNYLCRKDIEWLSWQISDIFVKEIKNNIELVIILGRPGLLIGPYGRTMDGITESLSDSLDRHVTIKIIEKNIWN